MSTLQPVPRRGRYRLLRDLGAALSELFVHLTPPRHRA